MRCEPLEAAADDNRGAMPGVQANEQVRAQKEEVMKRREFLRHAAGGMGAAALMGSAGLAAKHSLLASLGMTREERLAAFPALPRKFAASETVTIGKTGIQTSLLAMGTGTVGSGHHSHQTALGVKGLSEMLLNGYDHGLRFFDAADSYGSHPHVAHQ